MEKNRVFLRIILISLLCIILGFSGLYLYCTIVSSKQHVYYFDSPEAMPKNGLSLTLTVSKEWYDSTFHPEAPMGAQYDIVMQIDPKAKFDNWTVSLELDGDAYIDSAWNGTLASENGVVSFAPDEMDTRTFGAVIYSQQILQLKGYTISGNHITNMRDTQVFVVLLVAAFAWIVAVIAHIAVYLRTRSYIKRQTLDMKIINQAMDTFASFIDAKDSYTKGHSQRVSAYSVEIAFRMKLDSEEISHIFYTSMLHDCGKIGISDAVLKKNCELTEEEYTLIKSHTTLGAQMLRNFTAIPGIQDGARFHHERYDGKGYPSGLKGAEIPLCARIICIADAFDAMSSDRCYRGNMDTESIIDELQQNAGKQFDPHIVGYMIEMIRDGFVSEVQANYPVSFFDEKSDAVK